MFLKCKEQPKYFSCEDGERLTHEHWDDAIEDHLLQMDPSDPDFPVTITVTGYAPDSISGPFKKGLVDAIVNCINDQIDQSEYNDPESYSKPKQEWTSYIEDLAAVVINTMDVYPCHEVGNEEVDVQDWLKQNPIFG